MFRRTIAIALWAYFGWYLGGLVAHTVGLPQWLGPVTAVIMAAIAVFDWSQLRAERRGARTAQGAQPGT